MPVSSYPRCTLTNDHTLLSRAVDRAARDRPLKVVVRSSLTSARAAFIGDIDAVLARPLPQCILRSEVDLLRAALVASRKPSAKHGALLHIERACCEVDGPCLYTACHASEHRCSMHGLLSRVSFASVDCMINAPLASLTLFYFRLCIYQAVINVRTSNLAHSSAEPNSATDRRHFRARSR